MFAVKQTLHFNKWLSGLKDSRAKQKIALRIRRLGFGHFGDVKPVGDGVSELRIHEAKATALTLSSETARLSSCYAVGTRKPNRAI